MWRFQAFKRGELRGNLAGHSSTGENGPLDVEMRGTALEQPGCDCARGLGRFSEVLKARAWSRSGPLVVNTSASGNAGVCSLEVHGLSLPESDHSVIW